MDSSPWDCGLKEQEPFCPLILSCWVSRAPVETKLELQTELIHRNSPHFLSFIATYGTHTVVHLWVVSCLLHGLFEFSF